MTVKKLISVILILLLICGSRVWAQDTKTIKGKVTTFGEIPLNNVKITTSKTKNEVLTDFKGNYSIECIEKDVIRFYAAGFDSRRIRVKKIESPDVDMVYSNTESSFRNATENGHISEKVLKDAMSKYPLKGEKDYSNYTSIYELIGTEIYNVNVNGTSITTMKPTSVNASQDVPCAVNGTIVQDISYIQPTDVRSVRYVEGSEASRYGIRGANGVIEITIR